MRIRALAVLSALILLCLTSAASAQPRVVSFSLINAETDAPVPGHDPLLDGAVLDLDQLATRRITIRANTDPEVVGSVRFGLDSNTAYRTENQAPYSLAGDVDGNYSVWVAPLGEHVLTATPYPEADARGEAGEAIRVRFTIERSEVPAARFGGEAPPLVEPRVFLEKDGLVAVEVETAPAAADWQFETAHHGYTGDGYYVWRGNNLFADPGLGVLTYRIRIETPGRYHLRIRNLHDHPDASEENDCWARMDDGNWAKMWSAQPNQWNWFSHFDFSEHNKPPAGYDLEAGEHTFQISGRSHGFRIDRFHLFRDGAPNPETLHPQSTTAVQPEMDGERKKWHGITFTFEGPETGEQAEPNPFTDYRLRVIFRQGDREIVVPGFYAADGNAADTGAETGNKWQARFTPDAEGTWHFYATFHYGEDIALDPDPIMGLPVAFHGVSGTFEVGPSDKERPDFRAQGRLQYVNKHHLRFAESGEFFLKGGADSPENFLGYVDFDGTYDTGGIIPDFLHRYAPHAADWRPGDPTWADGRGRAIIGALNYLGSRGVNSVYFLTYNIDGGDGGDTWPWTSPEERERFDVSKLEQWERVFQHMDARGIQLHVVTQEEENDQALDGGELGRHRQLYYRELVARFAHHLAVMWNLGEENTNTDAQRKAFARYIRGFDPYDHPIKFHTHHDNVVDFYNGVLDSFYFEAASMQGDYRRWNEWTRVLREKTAAAGHPWAIYGDEGTPNVEKGLGNLDLVRKHGLWGNLMAGGAGVEWYFGYQEEFGDLQTEDFRMAEPLWDQTRHALEFFQAHFPFADMEPANEIAAEGTNAWVLRKPGTVYLLYLPEGGAAGLNLPDGRYRVDWFNPRTGGEMVQGSVTEVSGPGAADLGKPPAPTSAEGTGLDWAVLLRRSGD